MHDAMSKARALATVVGILVLLVTGKAEGASSTWAMNDRQETG